MTAKVPFRLKALGSALLAALVLGCGWAWERAAARKAIVRASVPARPDLSGRPAELGPRIAALEARIREGRGSLEALGELSRVYDGNGFYPAAIACYRGLIRADPRNPVWPYRAGFIMAGFGELGQAVPLFRDALRLDPRYVPAHIRLGDALFKLNRGADAAEAYAGALRRDPGNPYAMAGLARIDMDSGRWEAAREKLEQVVLRTDYRIGYDLLPTVYEKLGQPERSAAIRRRAKASGAYEDMADPRIDQLMDDCYDSYRVALAAGSADHRGDPAAALPLMARALALSPDDPALHYQLAGIDTELRSFEGARREYERCVQLDPSFADGWGSLAMLFRNLGDDASGDRILAEGLARCPRSPGLHLDYGRRLVQLGRAREAAGEFEASIRLRPGEAAAYVDLAQLLFSQGRLAEGASCLRKALDVQPDEPVALSSLTLYLIATGDEAAAHASLRRAMGQPRIASDRIQALVSAYEQRFGSPP